MSENGSTEVQDDGTQDRDYAVYFDVESAPDNHPAPAPYLQLVGVFSARTERAARWLAVDACRTEDGLSIDAAERISGLAAETGAYFVAIPVAKAIPRQTREEVRRVRR